MVKKVAWSQRVKLEDKEYLDSVIEAYRRARGLSTKGDALVHLLKSRTELGEDTDSDVLIPEVHTPRDAEFEEVCPFGYLKKIALSPGEEKWYCLKQQGPDRKGKPIVLADGYDKQSIRAVCEVCQNNWQTGPRNMDQLRIVFRELGEKEFTSRIYFCTRDALGEGVKFSPTDLGRFYCIERDRKVTIRNTCITKACPFLVEKRITLPLGETMPFREAQKALEVLT